MFMNKTGSHMCLVLFMLICPRAAALEIAPTTLVLKRDHTISSLRLANNGPQTQTYEISAHAWLQVDGEDQLSAAPDVIITPPVISLEPGEESVVRVGILNPSPHKVTEETYRLRIRDISPPNDVSKQNLHIQMEFLLPLIVPSSEPLASLKVTRVYVHESGLCTQLENDGNTYQKLVGLSDLETPDTDVVLHNYLLPASEATVCSDKLSDIPLDRIALILAPTYAAQGKMLNLSNADATAPLNTPH